MNRKHGKRRRRSAPPSKPVSAEYGTVPAPKPQAAPRANAVSLLYAMLRVPVRLIASILKRIVQVIFSIFFLVLHPQLKWLIRLLLRSRLVRNYILPALHGVVRRIYRPYVTFLRALPPVLATLSIAIPLAVLEPAKLYATLLIVEHPKTGLGLLLFLHGLSFVLIDTTWTAVRPQSRKIWLVARIHALVWLNLAYGRYWVKNSAAYRAMSRWVAEARRALRNLLIRLRGRWKANRPSSGKGDFFH
jgi:hypothetical protein